MMKNLLIHSKIAVMFLTLFLGSTTLIAQDRTITGTVTDAESGETLIGVNITPAEDLSIGTVSDIDGNYKLTVPETVTALRYSYVGYTSQIIEITSDKIDVTLMPGEMLGEIVVVGYGTQKTKEVTSAVSSIKEEDFNAGHVNNPIQLIQGKVPGLSIVRPGGDPNADFNIRLRGLSTFGSNTEPLVIVDGVQGASLSSVDPRDIASMDVLRDASAAAIYGTRAASGVILITTKKGSYEGEKKANVEFSTDLSVESIDRKLDVLTASEYRQFDNHTDYGMETDWMDELTRNAFSQAYNLAVNGATEKSNYRVSFNYRNANGVVRNTGFEQFNGRLNFSQKALNDMLTLNFNLAATMRDEHYVPDDAMGFVSNYNPTAPVMGVGSDTAAATAAFVEEWGGYFQQPAFSFYNPVAVIEQNTQDGKKQEIIGSIKADLEPVEWAKISAFYSQSRGNDLFGYYTSKLSYYNATNTEKNGSHNGFARKRTDDRFQHIFEITGEVEQNFKKFNVKLLGGYSWQERVNDYYEAYGEGFITDNFTYNNLGASSGVVPINQMIQSNKYGSTLIGFFSRASVNWNDAAFFTANFRRDGSTTFGENNKWGNFMGVSAGFDLVKFVDVPVFNRLKFRGGYGETGNLPPEPYLSQDLYGPTDGFFFYQGEFIQAYNILRNSNPELQWEIKKELGFGLDFFLLDYKLNGSIDYYQNTSSELMLYYRVPQPPAFAEYTWLNVGELENTGLEVVINYMVIDKEDFKWTTNFNYSNFLSTKLVKITNEIAEGDSERRIGELGAPFLTGVNTVKVVEGEEIGQLIAPVFVAIDTSGNKIYEDVNGDDEISVDDYQVVGNGLPDFQIGWGNMFTYKNFYMSMFVRGVFGHSLVNVNNARYGDKTNIGIQSGMGITLDYLDADDGLVYSDFHVEKASYVKLDNFSFGYRFGMDDNKYISNIELYVSGQNLFTISDYSGVDPEVRYEDRDDPLAPGIDRQDTYFRTRSFTLGVNVLF